MAHDIADYIVYEILYGVKIYNMPKHRNSTEIQVAINDPHKLNFGSVWNTTVYPPYLYQYETTN